MNTKEAAAYIRSSESYLDKAAVARRRAQEQAERAHAQGKPEPAVDLKKIGPRFRWIGSRREYDPPYLDDFMHETAVEPRRRCAQPVQSEI
jgi:hypothetical protein